MQKKRRQKKDARAPMLRCVWMQKKVVDIRRRRAMLGSASLNTECLSAWLSSVVHKLQAVVAQVDLICLDPIIHLSMTEQHKRIQRTSLIRFPMSIDTLHVWASALQSERPSILSYRLEPLVFALMLFPDAFVEPSMDEKAE